MALTRRHFVGALGAAGASAIGGAPALGQSAPSGAGPAVARRDSALTSLVKLDQNENPNPPSASVRAAITEAMEQGHRYPRNIADLADAIAKVHGVARENILIAAGSGELLRSTVLAFVKADRPLVAGLPTFETSTNSAKGLGLPVREIPVDRMLRLDLPAMEEAAVGGGLLFFCNPNNPTGTTWPTKDLEGMIDRLAKRSAGTTILVDEAYAHFVENKDYWSLAKRAAAERQLLVTRTFSKAFGLAGMRVGYAIGHADTIATLRRTTTSGLLPVTSIAAALAALSDEALMKKQIRENNANRAMAAKALQDLGYTVFPSDANFVLVDVKRKPDEFQAACRALGVAVGRPFPGLPTHSRISIGTTEEMNRAIAVFKQVLASA